MAGRPSLGVHPTVVRLSGLARDRIHALVGARGMAQFIREAIEHELQRREQTTLARKRKSPRSP